MAAPLFKHGLRALQSFVSSRCRWNHFDLTWGAGARTAYLGRSVEALGRAGAHHEADRRLAVPQAVTEILEVVENILQERISERIPKQTVSVPVPRVKLAGSSGEAGSSWPRVNDTTSVATAALAKSVGEA